MPVHLTHLCKLYSKKIRDFFKELIAMSRVFPGHRFVVTILYQKLSLGTGEIQESGVDWWRELHRDLHMAGRGSEECTFN